MKIGFSKASKRVRRFVVMRCVVEVPPTAEAAGKWHPMRRRPGESRNPRAGRRVFSKLARRLFAHSQGRR